MATTTAASHQQEEKGDGDGSSGAGSRGSRDRPLSPWRPLPPPPPGPIASPQFHVDSDDDDEGNGVEAWSAAGSSASSSASSLLDEVEEGFERQLDALARLRLGDGDGGVRAAPPGATPRTTDTEEADDAQVEEGLVLLLAGLPHGDKRRRWILNSLRLHAAQAAARRRRLLCLGAYCNTCGDGGLILSGSALPSDNRSTQHHIPLPSIPKQTATPRPRSRTGP